jgi:arginine decarboxylase-like protein
MEDKLENRFKELVDQFDLEQPPIGHFERFEARLKPAKKRLTPIYYMAIAASIALLFGLWIGNSYSDSGMELAMISSEMEETQDYFLISIQKQLETIENERNEDSDEIINDSLEQIRKLEDEYNRLTLELSENSEDKRIIFAMISNFQQRIDVLQNLLTKIEDIKQLKTQNHEKFI